MQKKLMIAAVAAIAVLVSAATASAAKPPPPGPITHNPIVFVHGWSESSTIWNTMISRFQADGWTTAELNNWSYNTSQSNVTTASQLQTKINQVLSSTGATQVDLITHSMGALSSRYYIKNLGGDLKVNDWVSLGGPNHGTDTANFCIQTSCIEMRQGSSFLTALNSGDETPGVVTYGTWWSPCDEIINPDSSVAISGASNTQTACLSHAGLYGDATVYGQVRNFVQ